VSETVQMMTLFRLRYAVAFFKLVLTEI
jgi:hypothetical protein